MSISEIPLLKNMQQALLQTQALISAQNCILINNIVAVTYSLKVNIYREIHTDKQKEKTKTVCCTEKILDRFFFTC